MARRAGRRALPPPILTCLFLASLVFFPMPYSCASLLQSASAAEDHDEAKEPMSVQEVMSEIETLRNLKNDAILDLKEYYVVEEENHVYVITEILYGGAVLDAILKMKDERYTEAEAKVVVRARWRASSTCTPTPWCTAT